METHTVTVHQRNPRINDHMPTHLQSIVPTHLLLYNNNTSSSGSQSQQCLGVFGQPGPHFCEGPHPTHQQHLRGECTCYVSMPLPEETLCNTLYKPRTLVPLYDGEAWYGEHEVGGVSGWRHAHTSHIHTHTHLSTSILVTRARACWRPAATKSTNGLTSVSSSPSGAPAAANWAPRAATLSSLA